MQNSTTEKSIFNDPMQRAHASVRGLFDGVMLHGAGKGQRQGLRNFLEAHLEQVRGNDLQLPRTLEQMLIWSRNHQQKVLDQYAQYLADRKAGEPRRYFTSRAHALYFLRAVAPTKLVDGSWLYSTVLGGFGNAAAHLSRTYFEELGLGDVSKNHVGLYRQLLTANGIEQWRTLEDEFFIQGVLQLALGFSGTDLIPEVIGFNLGYEQLPLHLLITTHELDELGIDPYYFTLHVTVDNLDTGHARRACEAACEGALDFGDDAAYWKRVEAGYLLNDCGVGTVDVIEGFDLEREVFSILERKSLSGRGAHSDYCRIEGKTVNEWLELRGGMAGFLAALERKGWIQRDSEPKESRFWGLLVGNRAKMFGVFNDYELQVLFDWIRGEAARDGRAFNRPAGAPVYSYRVIERLEASAALDDSVDLSERAAEQALSEELGELPEEERADGFSQAISPLHHWTARGRAATRLWLEMNAAVA